MPTIEQRKQERALARSLWLDSLIVVPYAIVAIGIGSLAMLSEVLRGGVLIIVTGFSLRTLRRTHRGLIVEITLGFAQNKTMGEVSQVIARMRDHLRNTNPDSDIVIVPALLVRRTTNNSDSSSWLVIEMKMDSAVTVFGFRL